MCTRRYSKVIGLIHLPKFDKTSLGNIFTFKFKEKVYFYKYFSTKAIEIMLDQVCIPGILHQEEM